MSRRPSYLLMLAGLCALLAGCTTTQSTRPVERNPQGFAAWTDQPPAYLLGPGDRVKVQFLLTPELGEETTVEPDGTIALRSAGHVKAEGLTAAQLEQSIAAASKRLLLSPIVTVSVSDPAAALIYVGGSVRRPGAYPVTGRRGIVEAIALANGLEPEAREDEVVLIRRNPDNRPMLRTVDVQAFVSTAVAPGDVPLYAGDIVFVPRNRISEVDLWVDQFINKLIPFSRSFGYSINRNTPGALL